MLAQVLYGSLQYRPVDPKSLIQESAENLGSGFDPTHPFGAGDDVQRSDHRDTECRCALPGGCVIQDGPRRALRYGERQDSGFPSTEPPGHESLWNLDGSPTLRIAALKEQASRISGGAVENLPRDSIRNQELVGDFQEQLCLAHLGQYDQR